ncbi:hypothetical protein EVAR_23840_1 [Eumeta japonica]|uniref:Uncharacterized protein n=1 Tax=Eumeta variegata TaxID=151549 RepID=A0A4C1V3Q8_EUMVA|nr:hypothetical protein EVAR_23840_1 [Eumeta japonica]
MFLLASYKIDKVIGNTVDIDPLLELCVQISRDCNVRCDVPDDEDVRGGRGGRGRAARPSPMELPRAPNGLSPERVRSRVIDRHTPGVRGVRRRPPASIYTRVSTSALSYPTHRVIP